MSTSTSTLKARHYAALSSSLRRLRDDLSESELQMVRLADHLKSMQSMGTYSAAQYVPSLFPFLSYRGGRCEVLFFIGAKEDAD